VPVDRGREGDGVLLDTAVVEGLMLYKERSVAASDGWLFANQVTAGLLVHHKSRVALKQRFKEPSEMGIGS
jgi:hypothetical protein